MNDILKDKTDPKYKYYASDFDDCRFLQWSSVWYQAREAIQREDVHSMLEFGTGRNLTKALVEHFGVKHLSVDIDNTRFIPDVRASMDEYKTDEKFDIVSAFQALEHNPYEEFSVYLEKFKNLSNKYIYISLPYSGRWLSFLSIINLPKLQFKKLFHITWERWFKTNPPPKQFENIENIYDLHHWEVGDKDTPLKVIRKTIKDVDLKILKEVHNPIFPYHIFFLLEK